MNRKSVSNATSPHILSTSANLLGFCLFVITSLHISNLKENHVIDEMTSIIAAILTFSCIFSFISIRIGENHDQARRLESVADYLFLISLIGIFIVISFITMNIID